MDNKIINKYLVIIVILLLTCVSSVSISGNIEQQKLNVLSDTKISQKNKFNEILFDFAVSHFMENLNFPGMSACIIKKDNISKKNEVFWVNSYGYRDIENNKPAINPRRTERPISKSIGANKLNRLNLLPPKWIDA